MTTPKDPRATSPANALHSRLLGLHKMLLDIVRAEYEKEHGPVGGPGPLLQLVTQDPAFAWLRPLSMLLVEMDDPTEVARAGGIRPLVETAFRAGNVFSDRYHATVASSADVSAANTEVKSLIDALPQR